jgi:myo-inositol-1(or 4)-monophosphatase
MKSVLIDALNHAGQIQMENFGKLLNEDVKESISSIVTEVDIKCEKKIIEIISSAFPNHNILSEECGFIDNHSIYTWIVDPIDGTSNFAAGIPWFGILIALLEHENPVMSGAYLPVSGDLYFAEKGKGSYLNNVLIQLSNKELNKVLFAFSTDYTNDDKLLIKSVQMYRYLVQHVRNIRCTNSLVDFLLVAEGKLGGCLNMFTKIWDIAATYLIIKEAGGEFKNLDFSEIKFELKPGLLLKNYSVIAGNQSVIKNLEIELSGISRT